MDCFSGGNFNIYMVESTYENGVFIDARILSVKPYYILLPYLIYSFWYFFISLLIFFRDNFNLSWLLGGLYVLPYFWMSLILFLNGIFAIFVLGDWCCTLFFDWWANIHILPVVECAPEYPIPREHYNARSARYWSMPIHPKGRFDCLFDRNGPLQQNHLVETKYLNPQILEIEFYKVTKFVMKAFNEYIIAKREPRYYDPIYHHRELSTVHTSGTTLLYLHRNDPILHARIIQGYHYERHYDILGKGTDPLFLPEWVVVEGGRLSPTNPNLVPKPPLPDSEIRKHLFNE
jgi:hypothetical protein